MILTDLALPSRNPPWSRDELILALDLYVRFKGNPPGKSSPEIMGLSSLLNRITGGPGGEAEDFRNPNGVYMKLMNFRRFDPVYQAQTISGQVYHSDSRILLLDLQPLASASNGQAVRTSAVLRTISVPAPRPADALQNDLTSPR